MLAVLVALTLAGTCEAGWFGATWSYRNTLFFVAADGATQLDHEIEEWNESGSSYVCVRVPRIDASTGRSWTRS